MRIPQKGRAAPELLAELARRKGADVPWAQGRVFAYVYDAGAEAMQLLKDAYALYMVENVLDPTSFPSCRELEQDILTMAIDLLRGDAGTRGSFTSGGTESILLSVKTARDHARATRRQIREPELVLPETAHPAFFKACAYFDVKPVVVPVRPVIFTADPSAMEHAITDRTIMLVASAPSYAHGVVDPIPELGAIAQRHGLLMHVDCCVGGMYLPWARQLGASMPDFDFSVPGVSQVSMDFHKWGYAAKGASCILYRDEAVWHHQLFAWSGWTGYTVVNTTMQSTKSGGPLAACWAILQHFGAEGYLRMARETQEAARKLREAVASIDGLHVLGDPPGNLLALAASDFDIFGLAQMMRGRGWFVQPQFGFGSSPANVHLSIGASNAPQMDAFIAELRDCVAVLRRTPAVATPQLLSQLGPLLEGSPAEVIQRLSSLAGSGGVLPDDMHLVNTLLNALPAETRDGLLVEFMKRLYAPS
jgi:glutamate/tyrosine decarboxylase-like PLP-dependent enzyme